MGGSTSSPRTESSDDFWPSVVAKAKAEKPVLGSYLAEARAEVGPSGLKLTLPSDFKKTGVQRDLAYLAALIEKASGRPLKVTLDVDASMSPRTVEDPRAAAPAEASDAMPWQDVSSEGGDLAEDPGVKRVLGVFPGRVRKGEGPKQA